MRPQANRDRESVRRMLTGVVASHQSCVRPKWLPRTGGCPGTGRCLETGEVEGVFGHVYASYTRNRMTLRRH